MKASVHLRSYLAHLFLGREMFQTEVVEKLETHILCAITIYRKSCRLWDNVGGKKTVQRDRPQMK